MDTHDMDTPQADKAVMRPVEELEKRAHPGEHRDEREPEVEEEEAPVPGIVPPLIPQGTSFAPAVGATPDRVDDEEPEQHTK